MNAVYFSIPPVSYFPAHQRKISRNVSAATAIRAFRPFPKSTYIKSYCFSKPVQGYAYNWHNSWELGDPSERRLRPHWRSWLLILRKHALRNDSSAEAWISRYTDHNDGSIQHLLHSSTRPGSLTLNSYIAEACNLSHPCFTVHHSTKAYEGVEI
jgi:hypothetical protein